MASKSLILLDVSWFDGARMAIEADGVGGSVLRMEIPSRVHADAILGAVAGKSDAVIDSEVSRTSETLPTDAMIDAAAEVMWTDRDARTGGPWSDRGPREVVVIQTKATARAALEAAFAACAKTDPAGAASDAALDGLDFASASPTHRDDEDPRDAVGSAEGSERVAGSEDVERSGEDAIFFAEGDGATGGPGADEIAFPVALVEGAAITMHVGAKEEGVVKVAFQSAAAMRAFHDALAQGRRRKPAFVDLLSGIAALRADGWTVGVHNDYRLAGEARTFWLFTHPDGNWVKGEGPSDAVAVAEALGQARARRSAGASR